MFDSLIGTFTPYIETIFKGVAAGSGAAFFGWLKSGEKFDGEKFTKTMIIGGAFGGLTEGLGYTPTEALEYLNFALVVYWIDQVTKLVWRRGLKRIVDWWKTVEEA